MCIVICSKTHPDYSLLLISNRDEFFNRPTMGASFVTPTQIRPVDLARSAHGTWIGTTTSGRVAVLVNYREQCNETKSPISRGEIPLSFLNERDDVTPLDWAHAARLRTANFQGIGGFSLLFGEIVVAENGLCEPKLYVMSNQFDEIVDVFGTPSAKLPGILRQHGILGLSNSTIFDPWPRVIRAEQLLNDVIQRDLNGDFASRDEFFTELLNILNDTNPVILKNRTMDEAFNSIPRSIFVPPLDSESMGLYGTRTQTLLAIGARPSSSTPSSGAAPLSSHYNVASCYVERRVAQTDASLDADVMLDYVSRLSPKRSSSADHRS